MMIAPEGSTSSTLDTNALEKLPSTTGVDTTEKNEKVRRIQDAASKATRNRKVSLDINRDAARRTSHLWSTGVGKLNAKRAFENGINGHRKGDSERDIMANDKAMERKHELKLPAIVLNGRRRSSTVGCVDELKQKVQVKKKSSFDSSQLYIQVDNGVIHEDCIDDMEGRRHELNVESIEIDGNAEQGIQVKVDSNDKRELSGENESVTGVYRLCGYTSHKRSLSRLHSDKQQTCTSKSIDNETTSDVPKQFLITNQYSTKVDEFLRGSQPKSAPKSLKISKESFNESTSRRRPHLVATSKSKLPICGDVVLTQNLYLNPFTRPDGKPWYYTSKEGRCRYLRAPMTPVLAVEEIFQNNDKQSSD